MDELMDMISKDESPSGISDAIKDALYAKSADKIGAHKNSVSNALFGTPEVDPEVGAVIAGAEARISGEDQNGEVELEQEPEGEE